MAGEPWCSCLLVVNEGSSARLIGFQVLGCCPSCCTPTQAHLQGCVLLT